MTCLAHSLKAPQHVVRRTDTWGRTARAPGAGADGQPPVLDKVALEVVLPRGVRVQVTSGSDVDSVARLVAALERAAC